MRYDFLNSSKSGYPVFLWFSVTATGETYLGFLESNFKFGEVETSGSEDIFGSRSSFYFANDKFYNNTAGLLTKITSPSSSIEAYRNFASSSFYCNQLICSLDLMQDTGAHFTEAYFTLFYYESVT